VGGARYRAARKRRVLGRVFRGCRQYRTVAPPYGSAPRRETTFSSPNVAACRCARPSRSASASRRVAGPLRRAVRRMGCPFLCRARHGRCAPMYPFGAGGGSAARPLSGTCNTRARLGSRAGALRKPADAVAHHRRHCAPPRRSSGNLLVPSSAWQRRSGVGRNAPMGAVSAGVFRT